MRSRLNNEKGSVIIVVLGFVLAFTLLGVASLHHTFMQNEIAEKEKASAEAFWMADGAMEKAMHKLAVSLTDMMAPAKDCMWDETHIDYPDCGSADSYDQMGRGEFRVTSTAVCVCNPSATDCVDDSNDYIPENCSASNGQVSSDNRKIRAYGWVNVPESNGTPNNIFRRIIAKFGSYDIENALTTHGTVNDGCWPAGSATITGNCVPHDPFTFETVFNGMSQSDFEALASANDSLRAIADGGQNYTLTGSSDLWGIAGVTVIHPVGNFNNPTFNTDNSAEYDGNPAFLIVDMTGYTGNPTAKLNIAGNADFCGIIWTVGEVKVEGTGDVLGAIFVDGDPAGDTPFTGNADLTFDLGCVMGAIAEFGGTGPPSLYAWKEFTQ